MSTEVLLPISHSQGGAGVLYAVGARGCEDRGSSSEASLTTGVPGVRN